MAIVRRAAVTCIAALVMSIGLASTAQAALPACNSVNGNPNFKNYPYVAQPSYEVNGSFTFNCFLNTSIGKSWNVGTAELQNAIELCYDIYLPGGHDGYFGPGTKAAVREVQRREGITQDGSYGSQTRTHMLWPTGIYEVDPACRRG